jgi:hypothetical protein
MERASIQAYFCQEGTLFEVHVKHFGATPKGR